MTKNNGFTLVELLIVLAIIGVLTAIALPNFTNYLIRGRVPDATSGLSSRKVAMEQYFQDNRTYVGATGCANVPASTYFDFSCTVETASAFTLQAAGKSSMAGFTYTVNQSGAKTTVIAAPAPTDWRTAAQTCWVTSQGSTC